MGRSNWSSSSAKAIACWRRCSGSGNRHTSANDGAASVLQAGIQDLLVQCVQTACFRDRHQPVAPEPPQLTFHAAFFVAAGRVAVLALIAPVRPERNDTIRLD